MSKGSGWVSSALHWRVDRQQHLLPGNGWPAPAARTTSPGLAESWKERAKRSTSCNTCRTRSFGSVFGAGYLRERRCTRWRARAAHGRQGKLNARDLQGQKNTSSCLTLVMACIIYRQAGAIPSLRLWNEHLLKNVALAACKCFKRPIYRTRDADVGAMIIGDARGCRERFLAEALISLLAKRPLGPAGIVRAIRRPGARSALGEPDFRPCGSGQG